MQRQDFQTTNKFDKYHGSLVSGYDRVFFLELLIQINNMQIVNTVNGQRIDCFIFSGVSQKMLRSVSISHIKVCYSYHSINK